MVIKTQLYDRLPAGYHRDEIWPMEITFVCHSQVIKQFNVLENVLPYCLELQAVSYRRLVPFNGWGNSIITKLNAGFRINAGSFVDPQ